jgi:hypothetical protein
MKPAKPKQLKPELVLLGPATQCQMIMRKDLGTPAPVFVSDVLLANPGNPSRAAILNSWKEIATFLHRGVRTVQRWEREFELPVHRIGNGNRSPVFAFTAEIQLWLLRNHAKVAGEISAQQQQSRVPQVAHSTKQRPNSDRLWWRCQKLDNKVESLMQQHPLPAERLAQTHREHSGQIAWRILALSNDHRKR